MSIVKLLGVPSAAGCRPETCSALDQHNGPQSIRSALHTLTRGYDLELHYLDGGDVQCDSSVPSLLREVERGVSQLLGSGEIPLLLGGAHTLTLGALRAVSKRTNNYTLVYFDAHPDLMPHPEINYGSGLFYALQEEVLDPSRMVLLGTRQAEDEERRIISEHNICEINSTEFEYVGAKAILKRIKDSFPAPYYLSIDLDAFDPAFAPGVGNPYPGGLTPREVMFVAGELCKSEVIGLEICQLSPLSDRNEETAQLAAALVLHLTKIIAGKTRRH